jgi:hypothetical protein
MLSSFFVSVNILIKVRFVKIVNTEAVIFNIYIFVASDCYVTPKTYESYPMLAPFLYNTTLPSQSQHLQTIEL